MRKYVNVEKVNQKLAKTNNSTEVTYKLLECECINQKVNVKRVNQKVAITIIQ